MSTGEVMVVEPGLQPWHCGNWGHRNKAGILCRATVITGTQSCKRHAGKPLAQAKAEGALRNVIRRWKPGDPLVDPGGTMLELLSGSRFLVEAYQTWIDELVAERGARALYGEAWGEGGGKIGEWISGLAQLDAAERDRCANFARIALAAGLAERKVRMAEDEGRFLAQLFRIILTDEELNLSEEQRRRIPHLIRKILPQAA